MVPLDRAKGHRISSCGTYALTCSQSKRRLYCYLRYIRRPQRPVGDEGDSHGAASLEGEIEPAVLLLTDKKATEVLRIGVPVR